MPRNSKGTAIGEEIKIAVALALQKFRNCDSDKGKKIASVTFNLLFINILSP